MRKLSLWVTGLPLASGLTLQQHTLTPLPVVANGPEASPYGSPGVAGFLPSGVPLSRSTAGAGVVGDGLTTTTPFYSFTLFYRDVFRGA
jgi:hypothetical protein